MPQQIVCLCTSSRENSPARIADADLRRLVGDGDWRRPRRLTRPLAAERETAVSAYSRGSAVAKGRDVGKGCIAPSYLTDLAVLTQDVFSVPAERIPATESQLTMIDGVIADEAALA